MTKGHPVDGGQEIFVSYAHENAGWIRALELDKDPASTESASFWVDKDRIHAGDRWPSEAQQALKRATTAVLLISREFLDSPSINEDELPAIMDRYRRGEIRIVFVPIGQLDTDEIGIKLGLDHLHNIISVPAWSSPLPIVAEPRGDIRGKIVSAATEPEEVQNLRRIIASQYELKKKLGDGHFSTLFTAYDRQLEREVAVKLLCKSHRDKHFRTAVTKVAHASDHTNILSVYAAYLDSDPPHYVVQYVFGMPLNVILDDVPDGKALPIDFVREFLTEIGLAISHAHRRNADDLNIKPCNIIVSNHNSRRERNYFFNLNSYPETDFLQDGEWRTNRDDVLYLPLEYRKKSVDWDDPRKADQYRLGLVAYEMLVGSKRFKQLGEPLRQRDFTSENWHWPALATERGSCPRSICNVVDQMVRTDPEDRYDSIDDAVAWVADTDLNVETVRDSYRRLMASEDRQTEFFKSFYVRFFRDYPSSARYFDKKRFGCLAEDCESSKGWQRQFQALKEAVLLLVVFKSFREEGREPNILTRIVEEHAKREIPAWLYPAFGKVLIEIVLEKDREPRLEDAELRRAWTSVVQPGIEYMKRKTEEIQVSRCHGHSPAPETGTTVIATPQL